MGCDIHIVLEKKYEGKWIGLKDMGYCSGLDTEERYIRHKIKARDYEFFWQLAGVRGGDGPQGMARGMPDDASELARMQFDDDVDLHSHGYHTVADLIPILSYAKYDKPLPNFEMPTTAERVAAALGDGIDLHKIVREYIDDDIEWEQLDDYRIVYAFDN